MFGKNANRSTISEKIRECPIRDIHGQQKGLPENRRTDRGRICAGSKLF
jgi:hypothetical protein